MSYNAMPLSSLAASQDPMGNSIHNRYSPARMENDFHGLRVFKALMVVHTILQNQDMKKDVAREEKGREELMFWMDVVLHDCKYGRRGYNGMHFPPASRKSQRRFNMLTDTP
jgi:hypothetical protein